MFIFNMNLSKLKYFLFIILFIIVLIILIISTKKIFFNTAEEVKINDSIPVPDAILPTADNYTDILETVYTNLETYIGQKVCFSGYVHRVYDLKENEFILARDMLISSDSQTLIVGFLCSLKNANDFSNGTWIEITGTIKNGEYHGNVPILEITSIQEIEKPSDVFVYPPKNSYVPTSILY